MAAKAGRIRVHAVKAANQDRGGLIEYHPLQPGDFGRTKATGGTPSVLLAEALRFYTYGSGRADLVVEKSDWLPIDDNTLPAALDGLVTALTDAIVSMFKRLAWLERNGRLPELPKYVLASWLSPAIDVRLEPPRPAAPVAGQSAVNAIRVAQERRLMATRLSVSANVGLLAGNILFSGALRRPEHVAALKKRAEAPKIAFREFEQLPPRLHQLRELVQWSRLQARLANEPRCAYAVAGGANVDLARSLFLPDLGGSWIIKPAGLPLANVLLHPSAYVGATEKLYYSVASSVFAFAHDRVARGGEPGRYGATLLREISDAVETVERVLPPMSSSASALAPWNQWQHNIAQLECLFDAALQQRVERPYDTSDDAGVRVGLPAAFILTGTLRVYLADLIGRALLLSLRQAIWRTYREVNGYLGVLLWEILSGEHAIGIKYRGCRELLAQGIDGKRLAIDRLPWEQALASRPWEPGDRSHQAALSKLNEIAKRPLAKSPGEPSTAPAVDLAAFTRFVPRSPPITHDFASAAGVTTARAPSMPPNCDLLFGLSFAAQLQVCVAFRLVTQAQAVLGWDKAKYSTEEPKDASKEGIVKRRGSANILITAGSYLWGGHKPPHGSSHRDGASVDLVFGANIFPWHRSKLSDALTKEEIAAFPELAREPHLLVAVYSRDDADLAVANHSALVPESPVFVTALEAMPLDNVVFLQLLRSDVVHPVVERLMALARDNPTGFKWDEEESAYREAEEQLAGTSHFIETSAAKTAGLPPTECTELGDWQRTHSAHAAILASGPDSMIFASPLTHVRAMRAIRATFCASGIELLQLERSDALVQYLDDPRGKALPEALTAAFRAAGIPIVGAPIVRCETAQHRWRMSMCDEELVLTATDASVLVAFLPAESAREAAGALVSGARFDPKPHDHHHHWHVRYFVEPARAMTRLESMRELWLSLAIDLEPFAAYLDRSFPPQTFDDDRLRQAAEQLAEVRRFCGEYTATFRERFGPARATGPGATRSAGARSPAQQLRAELARRLSKALFGHFAAGSELIAPAIEYSQYREGKVGAPLSSAIAKSRAIIQQVARQRRGVLEPAEPYPDYREEFIQGLRDLTLPPALEELKKLIFFHEPPKLSPESDAAP